MRLNTATSMICASLLCFGNAIAHTITILGSLDDHHSVSAAAYSITVLLNDFTVYDGPTSFSHGIAAPYFAFQRFSITFAPEALREGKNTLRISLHGPLQTDDWICWDSIYVEIGDRLWALESDAEWGYSPTGVDVVYAATSDSVDFTFLRGRMDIIGTLDDHYSVDTAKYHITLSLNSTVLFTGNLPFQHGSKEGGQYFTNFVRWSLPFATTDLLSGPNEITIALDGVGPLDWMCWDSIYLRVGDSVIAMESPNEWAYSPSGVSVVYGGQTRSVNIEYVGTKHPYPVAPRPKLTGLPARRQFDIRGRLVRETVPPQPLRVPRH